MMADDGNNNNVFVYMGGDQEVPEDVTHAQIHKSVKIITESAFENCEHLVSIEMHDGVEIIELDAFRHCTSLREIKLTGVRIIKMNAFWQCTALKDVEFGDMLDIIGGCAFGCTALRNINIPKVSIIEEGAFYGCKQLTEVELSRDLETIELNAFLNCPRLRRIALPLKRGIFEAYSIFEDCPNLSTVDIIGGIHNAVSSLLLERWRDEMNREIDRINQVLPNTPHDEKTEAIQQWLETACTRIELYKSKHYELLKDYVTLLELALWKFKLRENEGDEVALGSDLCALLKEKMTLLELARCKAKFDERFAAARQAERVNCGANIIIPLVLPFLNDDDVFPLVQYDPTTL